MIRLGVVSICISITVYHGYGCTEKFVSNPATVNDENVPLNKLPPLQWSICKQFVVMACTDTLLDKTGGDGGNFGNLFAQYDNDETENEYDCNHLIGQIPNHSNTTSFYLEKLTKRTEFHRITDFIAEIDIWNRSSLAWEPIYNSLKYANGSNIFR